MNSKNNMNEEEVALGQFFQMLASFIKWIFFSIFKILKTILNYVLDGLTFLRKYWIINITGLIIGASIGFIISNNTTHNFESNLIIKTNFGAGKLLYNEISYLNNLIKTKNFEAIKSEFELEVNNTQNLKKISITPIINEEENANIYNNYLKDVDTNFYKPIKIDKYLSKAEPYLYRLHEIKILHTGNLPSKKITNTFIKKVSQNPFFKHRQNEKNQVLNESIGNIEKEFKDLDSLKNALNQALKNQKNNQTSDPVLSISQGRNTPDLSWIYSKSIQLQSYKNKLKNDLIEQSKVIEILSPLKETGIKQSRIKTILMFTLFGFLATIFCLAVLKLNYFLASRIS